MDELTKGGIRIVSDGSITGTKLYSPSGKELKGARVRSVTWAHKAGEIPRVAVEFLMPEMEVTVLSSEAVEWVPSQLKS